MEWISVKDKLPPDRQPVLLAFHKNCAVGFYNSKFDVWHAYCDNACISEGYTMPLYWMPLPKAPEA
jgi:hypothetical protein